MEFSLPKVPFISEHHLTKVKKSALGTLCFLNIKFIFLKAINVMPFKTFFTSLIFVYIVLQTCILLRFFFSAH